MSIKIFVTGGTFDKEHDPISEQFVFNETHVPELLQIARSQLDVSIRTVMLIDSIEISNSDMEIICHACKEDDSDRIIITHGTSNMEKTAHYLGERIKDKTVILTGAMVPYVFSNSDAQFNMGAALAFVQTLPFGVYIVMNGKCYDWDNVTKNVELGLFEEIRKS